MKRSSMRWTEDDLEAVKKGEAGDPKPPLESAVLEDCMSYCALHPKVAWHARQNVGAFVNDKGDWVKFSFRGAADITGQLKDGRRFEFEVKRAGKSPSSDQLAFLSLVAINNGVAGWGGLSELEKLLREA